MSMGDQPRAVGYVIRKFPTLSETFVLNELLALEARGVPLHVFSLYRPNDPRFHEDLSKLRARVTYVPDVFELGKLLRHNWRAARRHGKRYAGAFLYALARVRPALLWRLLQAGYVASEAQRLKIRHLHAQFANRPATVAFFAARLAGISYSFTAHATDIYKTAMRRGALSRKAKEARLVVTISDFNREYLERVTGAGEKIVRIYNGIDLARFDPDGGPPTPPPFRLLCVARLVEKKGLPLLLEACSELRDRGSEFGCEIVGKGILRPLLEDLIERRRLQRHIRLLGPLTHVEVRDCYRRAHLFVLPCIVAPDGNREGLPVSIVEALACGVPVVSTPVTGIPEVVRDGYNGLLVPPGDARALAVAIERLMRDPALYDGLRANARSSVADRFDLRHTAAELHRLFEAAP